MWRTGILLGTLRGRLPRTEQRWRRQQAEERRWQKGERWRRQQAEERRCQAKGELLARCPCLARDHSFQASSAGRFRPSSSHLVRVSWRDSRLRRKSRLKSAAVKRLGCLQGIVQAKCLRTEDMILDLGMGDEVLTMVVKATLTINIATIALVS